ncbi:MAG: asparagine synthase (glutamine-hydrolyzing), partial [Candidatus Levybacteria bacterium]|nr:asparagine synthase (glutamine-hydrolyzing) [Candidatus Levybacteria bacterium]
MVNITVHRGPDTTVSIINKKYGIGFNRLKIVGGNKGQQPIYDKGNKIYLICNGEIFNHIELRKRYCRKEEFLTESDVEIILHLYKKFDKRCIEYLEGQFAFLLYDTLKNVILIGRDRFGINPLFYSFCQESFIVASEIKAILSTKLINNVFLDTQGIAESMFFYGAIPPRTCFTNIFQLPPGYFGVYDIKNKNFFTKSYFNLKENKNKIKTIRVGREKLQELLIKSVQKRLQGKYTPGVYLSGGLDSSVIGYLVNKLTSGNTKFFSISFKNHIYDESLYQKKLAGVLKITLRQIRIDFDDIVSNFEECIFHVETPLIRTAPVPMLLLSKMVRKENIKFVFCGEGADEMFAGYPVFMKGKSSFEDKWIILKNFLPLFKGKEIRNSIERTYKKLSQINKKESLLTQCRKKEIETKLSQYLLVNQGDRMSMANGVEQRFPFLDSEVVKYAFSLHDRLLV